MESSRLAVFRADASPQIGGGHVMRCLTLADHMAEQGWDVSFCTQSESLRTAPKLASRPYRVHKLHASDDADVLKAIHPHGCDVCVVDSYSLDERYESRLRDWAKKILVIDDLANRKHDCDLLLDPGLKRNALDYTGLVTDQCQLLLGPRYIPLRPQFRGFRDESLTRRLDDTGLKRIQIGVGASDPHHVTMTILRSIEQSGLNVTVDVIMGGASPCLSDVQALSTKLPFKVAIHVDTDDVAKLMTMADLAIGAGGSTAWERCCLGLPSFIITLSEAQKEMVHNFDLANSAHVLGNWSDLIPNKIAADLIRFSEDKAFRNALSVNAAALCDGLGSKRVLENIQNASSNG